MQPVPPAPAPSPEPAPDRRTVAVRPDDAVADLLVIGAGLAGIAAAQSAAAHGLHAIVIDKGRGIGGRMASRRVVLGDGRTISFDHGAQFMTARSPALVARMVAAEADGAVRRLDADDTQDPRWVGGHPRWVGVGAMTALVKALARGLEIRPAMRVARISRDAGIWILTDDQDAVIGRGRRLIVTTPPEQALDLLIDTVLPEGWRRRIAGTLVAPCWALMLATAQPLPLPAPRWRPDDEAIAWISDQRALPGHNRDSPAYVVHATPHWSRVHLERDAGVVASLLTGEIGRLTGTTIMPLHAQAHRWRHALVELPLGAPCLADRVAGLAIAGDWCIGGRAEAAVDSGRAAALALAG